MIKTWSTTIDDLLSLGLKIYLPEIQTHGLLHLGTRDIQLTLLKSGLLLGIDFRYDSTVQALVAPDETCASYRACFISNAAAAAAASCNSTASSDDETTILTSEVAAAASATATRTPTATPTSVDATVLSFAPCEQRPEELWHTSVVDMIEVCCLLFGVFVKNLSSIHQQPESERGAIIERSVVDKSATMIEFDGIIVAEGEVYYLLFSKQNHDLNICHC